MRKQETNKELTWKASLMTDKLPEYDVKTNLVRINVLELRNKISTNSVKFHIFNIFITAMSKMKFSPLITSSILFL